MAGVSFAVGAYTGPVGGKIAGGIAGKVIPPLVDKLPDTPITDVRNKIREIEGKPPIVVPPDTRPSTSLRPEIVLRLTARERSMISAAAKDHGATLRWECAGVPLSGNPMTAVPGTNP